MRHNKKTREGATERIALLREDFAEIEKHLSKRPHRVGADDLLDAAAAAWTALRYSRNEVESVCSPEHDERGLATTIWY
jgi:predicted RNase H-like nuclease